MKRPRYLLDTNICIYIAKKSPPEVLERFRKLRPGDVAMSVITHGELCYGACKSSHHADAKVTLERLATLIPVLPIGTDVGTYYGQLRSRLGKEGCLIGNNDLWIAAHALALGTVLVTNNELEFRRVNGLAVENWVKLPPAPSIHESLRPYGARVSRRRMPTVK